MQGYGARYLRVYLVDDHDLVRRGVRDVVASARDLDVVGESGSADRAVTEILELKPDVMLLDVQLADGTGVQVCRAVRAAEPSIRGLLLTSAGDDEALTAALLAGADGYLLKLASGLAVVDAIRKVGAGRSLIDPDQRARVVRRLLDESSAPAETSRIEQDFLGLVMDGWPDAEIAEATHLSRDGVTGEIAKLLGALVAGEGDHLRHE